MQTVNVVWPNRYQDSVTLMQVAATLRARAGIADAALMMGTPPNKEMLEEAGLLVAEGTAAGPNDLIVALQGDDPAVTVAQTELNDLLQQRPATTDGRSAEAELHSLAAGLVAWPDANLVLISTPGLYAAAEAHKALAQGRHVLIFSDNVSLDDEVRLKQMAHDRGLLLMGPDCGTAIIGGVPLGFANAVRRGSISVVGASGTGMQEITTLVDRGGGGIAQAIGTGSHDLAARVGALTTLAALQALQADPATEVIVLVSKPPDPAVARRVVEAAAGGDKPVVVAFLGLDPAQAEELGRLPPITLAHTLEDAARHALHLVGVEPTLDASFAADVLAGVGTRHPAQKYVRGLFSGGTFCYEAQLLLRPLLGPIYSNAPLSPELAVTLRTATSPLPAQHVCLDLGADMFTVGRPHPMIDGAVRQARLLQEADDPQTAVLLLDVVLGYGAHPNPAGDLAPALVAAHERATAAGRTLPIVAALCGTEADPQRRSTQQATLEAAGVIVAPSNAAAARLAAQLAAPQEA